MPFTEEMLNPKLIIQQEVDEDAIKELCKTYDELDLVITETYNMSTVQDIQEACKKVEEIEYKLQELWKFPQDSNFHSYWFRVNMCCCPRKDNVDPMFFGSGKIIAGNCPIHGKGLI